MSEKIDVLGALDSHARLAHNNGRPLCGAELEQVRAAVDELIQAAQGIEPVSSGWKHATPEDERRYKRLAAALEGCGVAANV